MKQHTICLKDWEAAGLAEGRITQVRRPLPRLIGRCPFGFSGDVLLCKEAYALQSQAHAEAPPWHDGRPIYYSGEGIGMSWTQAHYRATDPMPALLCEHEDCNGDPCSHPWRAAQTMPREFVRIKPLVVSVRAERANAITEADALTCGIVDGGCLNCGMPEPCKCDKPYPDKRDSYIHQWILDYGKRSPWDSWAWVCEVAPEVKP